MPLSEVERLGILINEAMSAPARSFHTPQHVIDLADPESPHTTLAALFHDLVYYQVDHGLHPQISSALAPSIGSRDRRMWLRPGAETDDRALVLTMGVFGFSAGQQLELSAGMNEFLSALVMNRSLAAVVGEADLIFSTACIEATIPFRKNDAEGRTAAEVLERRLARTAREMGVELSEERSSRRALGGDVRQPRRGQLWAKRRSPASSTTRGSCFPRPTRPCARRGSTRSGYQRRCKGRASCGPSIRARSSRSTGTRRPPRSTPAWCAGANATSAWRANTSASSS